MASNLIIQKWFADELSAPTGGGSAYSLSGAAGSYVLAGRAAALSVSRLLSGSSGAYAITGRSATLVLGHVLSGSAGSYSVTGRAASFAVARNLAGAAGAYSLSGQVATLTYTPGAGSVAYTLSGAAGTYALSGGAAVIGINRLLSGSAGSYAIAGHAASFSVARQLAGSAGAYALAGQPATLTYAPGSGSVAYTLGGATGSYILTGADATLQVVQPITQAATPGRRLNLRSHHVRRGETDAEKYARRLAQGTIREAKTSAADSAGLFAAQRYVDSLKASVEAAQADVQAWKAKAHAFSRAREAQDRADALGDELIAAVERAQIEQNHISSMLAIAQEQASIAEQEIEALDVAFVMATLAEA